MVRKNWKAIAEVGNEQLRINLITAHLVQNIDRRDDVVQACKDAGLPYKQFGFRGSCRGSTEGVSYAQGGYGTVRYGHLAYFYRSSQKRGNEIEYEGASWLVLWNGYSSGSAEFPGSHSLVIVPVEALA